MERTHEWYRVYKGWYRRSLSRPSQVWHRISRGNFAVRVGQTASTVCGRNISYVGLDFNIKPKNKCIQCSKPTGVLIDIGSKIVLSNSISILNKTSAISELKRLLKPRIYYLKIFGTYGIRIIAQWKSDVSIDIDTETEIMTKKRTKGVMTMYEIQADLDCFKSAIDCLIDASTILARKDKKKKQLKGRLTEYEDQCYFEELLYKAEK